VPLVVYRSSSSSPDPTLSFHESKAFKHGHCRGRTSSIGADREDDGIWIYRLVGSFIVFNNMADQVAPVCVGRISSPSATTDPIVFMLFRYTRGRRARQQIHFSALDYVINNLLQPDPLVSIVSGGRIWLSRLHRVRSTPSTTS
jgi:hypothetical protein